MWHIRGRIRERTKIGKISKKNPAKEVDMVYGHVMRRKKDYVGRRAMGIHVIIMAGSFLTWLATS